MFKVTCKYTKIISILKPNLPPPLTATSEKSSNVLTLVFTSIKPNFLLQQLLVENERVRAKIPVAFESLMGPHLAKVDAVLGPGITKLTWTSLNMSTYVRSVYEALADLELLMDRANDLVEFRIDSVLREMAATSLCELPGDEPWTVEEFLETTQVGLILFYYPREVRRGEYCGWCPGLWRSSSRPPG